MFKIIYCEEMKNNTRAILVKANTPPFDPNTM